MKDLEQIPTAALPINASLEPSAHIHAARELAGDPNLRQYVRTPTPPLERELPAWFVVAVLVGWSLLAAAVVVWSVGVEIRGDQELLERIHARSPDLQRK